MTPKEKAEELLDRFIDKSVVVDDDIQYYHPKPFSLAKQCALIAVDEILNNDGFTKFDIYLTEYWQEVKQELEKL